MLAAVISNFFVCGALFRPLELQWKLMEFERSVLLFFLKLLSRIWLLEYILK